ncbi:hypothetical protein [Anaerolentibacter hominis]
MKSEEQKKVKFAAQPQGKTSRKQACRPVKITLRVSESVPSEQ